MNKPKKMKRTKRSEDIGLKIVAYLVSAVFVVLILFPLVYTFGNSLKDDNKIYEIPPTFFPTASRSFTVVLDYSGMNLDEAALLDLCKSDSTMAVYSLPYELNKDSIYEVKFFGVLDGKTVFYARVHRSQVRLELDFGIYKQANVQRDVLLYNNRYQASADKFGYTFDMNGVSQTYDARALGNNDFNAQVENYLVNKYQVGGKYLGTIVTNNIWLMFESYKYYFILPAAMYPDVPIIQQTGYGVFLLNTVIVLVFAVVAQSFLCALTAFPLSRLFNKKTANIVLFVFLGTMMVPFVAIMVPQFLMFKSLGLYNNYGALLVPYLLPGATFIFLYKVFFDQLPGSLFEAAQIDGASTWYCFTRICIPLSKPIISLVALTTLLNNWSDFFWGYLVARDPQLWTLNVALYRLSIFDKIKYNFIMGLAFATIIPVLLITVIFSKQVKQSLAQTGIKG